MINIQRDDSIKPGVIVNDVTVLNKDYEKSSPKKTYFNCKCNVCNRERSIRKDAIKAGRNTYHKDCGRMIKKNDMKFYDCWRNMRMRTTSPNATGYENYGGRGISSEDYKYFVDFYDDLYDSYKNHRTKYGVKDTTLDRIDSNGNYTFDNIRWATRKEQNQNLTTSLKVTAISKKDNSFIEFDSLNDAGKHFNIHNTCIKNRALGDSNCFIRDLEYDFKIENKY